MGNYSGKPAIPVADLMFILICGCLPIFEFSVHLEQDESTQYP